MLSIKYFYFLPEVTWNEIYSLSSCSFIHKHVLEVSQRRNLIYAIKARRRRSDLSTNLRCHMKVNLRLTLPLPPTSHLSKNWIPTLIANIKISFHILALKLPSSSSFCLNFHEKYKMNKLNKVAHRITWISHGDGAQNEWMNENECWGKMRITWSGF